MTTRSLISVLPAWLLIATVALVAQGCGEESGSALEPPLLEGPEAVQVAQAARESGVRLHGPGVDDLDWPPVFFIDGQRVEDDDLSFLDDRPHLIKSVRVFRGDGARAAFGPEVGEHVIEITLKEPPEALVSTPDSGG
jgi:hypothetical protein